MPEINKYIVAIGGGGFTHKSDRSLDDFLLEVKDKNKLNLGFLATASMDDNSKIKLFYERFKSSKHLLSHFNLYSTVDGFKDWMQTKDIVYVGGGNTYRMIEFWKKNKLFKIFENAYESGVMLCGVSAGAICWFNSILSNSKNKKLEKTRGLGFINYSCTPHTSSEPERLDIFQKKVKDGSLQSGFAIDDGVALLFVNGKFKKVFSSRTNHSGYFISKSGIKNLEE
tara:strand:- start:87 stop:764 length:678 start_codon:yes stop_codon:yes gene_type:complete